MRPEAAPAKSLTAEEQDCCVNQVELDRSQLQRAQRSMASGTSDECVICRTRCEAKLGTPYASTVRKRAVSRLRAKVTSRVDSCDTAVALTF